MLVILVKGSFGAYFQAEHIKAVCSAGWVACVLTANKLNQTKTTVFRRSRLSCFVPHQSDTVMFTYVQTNRTKVGNSTLSQNNISN